MHATTSAGKCRSAAEVHRVQFLENCTMHLHLRSARFTWQGASLPLARRVLSMGVAKNANCTSWAAWRDSKCRSAAREVQKSVALHFETALCAKGSEVEFFATDGPAATSAPTTKSWQWHRQAHSAAAGDEVAL